VGVVGRRLVDRAHELGLACLVDIVLNHGSSKNNTLWMWDGYGPDNNGGIYFETGDDTPWGRQFSFDKPEVFSYLTGERLLCYGEQTLLSRVERVVLKERVARTRRLFPKLT